MAKSKAAMAEEARKKKIRETNKEGVMSFFDKYIAGRKTKVKAENKTNAKNRVANKTKSKTSKKTPSMADIRSKNKEELSSFFSKYIAGRKTRNLVSNPKGVSQGSSASKSPKSSLGYPKVSQGSKTAAGKTGYPKVSQGSKTAAGKTGYPQVSQGSKTAAGKTGYPKVSQGSTTSKKRKPAIVSKAALEKSGLSLRDYLNMKQGKTRKDYKDVKMAASKKRRAKGANT